VSSRYDRDDLPVLPEEDDWFATPFPQEPMETDEVAWQDDEPDLPPRPAPDGLAQRQIVIVLAVLAIIAVIAIAILLVRAVSGSGDSTATTPVTTPTTPTDTTPANTTPTDTTPASTTPTDTTPTDTTPSTSDVTSVPTGASLRAGSTGTSVTALQNALNQLGYDAGTADGNFGATTTAAVIAFQKAKGLTEDGVAGATTLTAINTALAAG
jgi:murein L,D-transpeptidase YcbB/YkuD